MEFFCSTRIVAGTGVIAKLKALGSKKLLLVSDPFFVNNGWAQKVQELSGAKETALFSEITPDPAVETVAKGAQLLKSFAPDTVVALGGGSAMDCAKAMVYFSGMSPKLVAIPTTSGSGSEVTDFAILTHDGIKHPLVDETLRPYMAILDGELLEGLPKGLIADSGFDVLAHALEAYVAKDSSPFTDAMAENAFSNVLQKLPASFAGDKSVRLSIHCCATMAGVAFTRAGLGLCHAMAHSLGGIFHIPHGRLNAILLPSVIDSNTSAYGKYAAIARKSDLGAASDMLSVRNLKNGLCRLRNELLLPSTLWEAGVSPQKVWENREKIVSSTLADPCCATNPQKVTAQMVQRVLQEVTGRG